MSGCGKLSNVVDIGFNQNPQDSETPRASTPFVGMLSAGGTKTSGSFSFEGSIGNQMPTAKQSTDGFTFYGGISGEVFSR